MFIFSSEIKGILENRSIERRLNLNSLDQLITFPGVISPNTMFKDIYSLEAGHYLIVSEEKVLNCEYWDLVFYKDKTEEKSEQQYIEELDALLDESVRLRLNADVPVGFYVSGGLDSSLIAAKINNLKKDIKNAFSVYFDNKTISELRYQEMICKFLNLNHYKRKIDIYDIAENLKNVIYFSETPLKETYNTASFLLSAMVEQQKTKVVLTGEGADELFAGYIGYSFDLLKQRNLSDISMDIDNEIKIRKTLWNKESFVYEKNYASYEQIKKSLYSEALVNIYDSFCCHKAPIVDFKKTDGLSVTQLRSYVDFKLRLSDHLLSDHGDRMAYANSIEARYPFLDKNIIEIATKLPDNMKIRNHVEKIILKKIGENILPPQIVNRPKFSFVAPGSVDLLRLNHEYINDMLNVDRIKRMGIFNTQKIESLKCKYSKEGFKLNLPFENDLLIIVLTLNIFMDLFKVTL
jgi:asparagine synthase (glutamine-hydrolysing)